MRGVPQPSSLTLTSAQVRTKERLGVSPWREVERLLTPQELAPIRAVFAEVDRDGDGWLTASDLQRSAVKDGIIPPHDPRGRAKVEEWLWEVDDDADGRLSFADFALLYGRIRKGLRKAEPHRLCNYLIFKLIDANHDGVLKVDEMYSYLCHILDKEMANYNMSRVLGAAVDSPDTAKISPAAWMQVLDSALWENTSPVLDTRRNSDSRQSPQRRHRPTVKAAAAAAAGAEGRPDRHV